MSRTNPSVAPFFANLAAIATPFGTTVAPGARVAAYVRATPKSDDPDFVRENRVASINEGLKRCREGMNDIVYVLPGHTETHSSSGDIWPDKKAGSVVVGLGRPGSTNAPRVTLSHTGASMALDVDDLVVTGLDIRSATAAVTGAVVVTGDGCVIEGCKIALTGALGANPAIAVTGAADFRLAHNHIVANSTDPIVEITGAATTDMEIVYNFLRQAQGTSGGAGISVASTAGISGLIAHNVLKTATGTAAGGILTVGASAAPTVGVFQNFAGDDAAGSGALEPAVMTLA
jgi:hypothetical protein